MSIFYGLQDLRKFREELYKPVQEAIKSKTLINESYRLQFQAKLTCVVSDFSSQLFEKVLQNTGDFRGEKESLELIENLANDCDFDSVGSVMVFLEKIHKKLQNVDKSTESITKALRARVEPHEVYDWLFGLSFIRPKYSLAFQGAEIEQLSPGQRGALLLIFYLLVDKNKHPIVLDQPEENLDNETVVSLLVPVLTQVKNYRQVIMVTHNPNLAVVCDAEQIIHATFDRTEGLKITYEPGSIESSETNQQVVNILEGTKLAFNNRQNKYF